MQSKFKSFRELVESKIKDDDYEPLPLLLIPLYSQTRQQYYKDVADSIKGQLDNLWNKVDDIFTTRDEFEESDVAEDIWARHKPYWWGLNDTIGWIDIRFSVRHHQIQLSLYLPSRQVLTKLKEKKFVFQYMEVIDLPNAVTNDNLQKSILEKMHVMIGSKSVEKFFAELYVMEFMGSLYLKMDGEIQGKAIEIGLKNLGRSEKKFFVDLEPWYCIVRHTDLVGIIGEFTRDYQERNSKDENAGYRLTAV